jgi:hypothetical protein
MNNKVITTAARACQRQGLATLRFNFRGVGQSEGAFAHGIGEQMDLAAVISWMEHNRPELDRAAAGFSFGSAMAASVARHQPLQWLITVAPPVTREYWPELPVKSNWYERWLIIQGGQDEVTSPDHVKEYWASHLRKQPALRWIEDSGHFFHGRLVRLRTIVERWLNE